MEDDRLMAGSRKVNGVLVFVCIRPILKALPTHQACRFTSEFISPGRITPAQLEISRLCWYAQPSSTVRNVATRARPTRLLTLCSGT